MRKIKICVSTMLTAIRLTVYGTYLQLHTTDIACCSPRGSEDYPAITTPQPTRKRPHFRHIERDICRYLVKSSNPHSCDFPQIGFKVEIFWSNPYKNQNLKVNKMTKVKDITIKHTQCSSKGGK